MQASIRKVIQHMLETVKKYDHTYLMVSGGVDSMFLFDLMVRNGFSFEVIHFQHHIRDTDDVEAQGIKTLCEQHGITFHHGHGRNISKTNTEAQAHDQRWKYVESVISGSSNLVITAHNLNDNVEQVFMSLMRGKPHDSLNMKTFSYHRNMVRYKPLLSFEKEEIYRMSYTRDLWWVEDESNTDEKYTRNMVRGMISQLNTRVNLVKAMKPSLSGVEC
jgi:tRNA(Ile)-lysidine synthetase-like protein